MSLCSVFVFWSGAADLLRRGIFRVAGLGLSRGVLRHFCVCVFHFTDI